MATLRRRKRRHEDGLTEYWVVDFSLTENGKTSRKQEHFRVDPSQPERARLQAEQRKAEIERRLAQQRLQGKPGSLDDGPLDIEVRAWLDAFAKAIRPNCCDKYHHDIAASLSKLCKLLKGQGIVTTARLRRQHFTDFVRFVQGNGNKPKSVHNELAILKRAVRWGIDEGYLDPTLLRSFPSVKVPRQKRRALSKDEIEQLLSAAEGTEVWEPVMLGLYTGGRRGELVQLRRSDVDLKRGVLRFRAETTKSGEYGEVRIHRRLRTLLEKRASGDGYLLVRRSGEPWSRDAVSKQFRALVSKKLGWQDVSFHCLRHTFGTQLAATGRLTPFDVQRLMRHRNIATSMIYVNLANEDLPSVDF